MTRGLHRLRTGISIAFLAALLAGCGANGEPQPQPPSADATVPLQQIRDHREAAEAAGCELINAPEEGRGHADREFTIDDYETNPPTSGDHHPEWYPDGVYEPGEVSRLGMLVHSLEHGRIHVQYAPGTPETTVQRLEAVVAENDGYHMLMYENPTDMEYQVAATAWTRLLGCPEMNDRVFDAIRTFRNEYIDQGPEFVP